MVVSKMKDRSLLFVWDFHGVLEKDNELAVLEVTNQVLGDFGYDVRASIDDIHRMYGLKWAEYYRRLVPGVDEDIVEKMVLRSRELGRPAASRYIKPQDHVETVLREISERGHRNVVVSNTAPKDLEFFMDLVGVSPLIDEFYGVDEEERGTRSKNKADIIEECTSGNDYRKIIVIGDTEKDIEVGLRTQAVTYLFKPRSYDEATKAHHSIMDLREVLRELE
jgi:phosphoglycolate phosphatase-like HAD superfamily hydrolase